MKFFLRLLLLLLFPALSLTAQVPEVVDLGLSVKWSSMNLGAECPEGYGDYFMWGEITPANDRDCSWSTYKYANGAEDMLTKYVPKPNGSTIGILGVLAPIFQKVRLTATTASTTIRLFSLHKMTLS